MLALTRDCAAHGRFCAVVPLPEGVKAPTGDAEDLDDKSTQDPTEKPKWGDLGIGSGG